MTCVYKDAYNMDCEDCQRKGECGAMAMLCKEDRTSEIRGRVITIGEEK